MFGSVIDHSSKQLIKVPSHYRNEQGTGNKTCGGIEVQHEVHFCPIIQISPFNPSKLP